MVIQVMANKKLNSLKRVAVYCLLVLFFSSSYLTFLSVKMHLAEERAKSWALVSARLLKADVKKFATENTKGGTRSFTYRPDVIYEYYYNDTRYIGQRVSWVERYNDTDMLAKANTLIHKYTNDQPINIYINPNNPKESVIYRTKDTKTWRATLITGSVLWLLFLFFSAED